MPTDQDDARRVQVQFRLSKTELADIDSLGAAWGGAVRPLTRTDVVREMTRRSIEAERALVPPKPAKKNPRKPT